MGLTACFGLFFSLSFFLFFLGGDVGGGGWLCLFMGVELSLSLSVYVYICIYIYIFLGGGGKRGET